VAVRMPGAAVPARERAAGCVGHRAPPRKCPRHGWSAGRYCTTQVPGVPGAPGLNRRAGRRVHDRAAQGGPAPAAGRCPPLARHELDCVTTAGIVTVCPG